MNDAPITSIKGIGPRRAELLGKLGLFSLSDVLRFAPRDYMDYSSQGYVAQAVHGENAIFRISVQTQPHLVRVRRGLTIITAQAQDDTGQISLVWYNQPYRKDALHTGDVVYAAGRVDVKRGRKLINPTLYKELPGILPIYPLTSGLSQTQLREVAHAALFVCGVQEESLPDTLINRYGLCKLDTAIRELHFPHNIEAMRAAHRRLAFEDALIFKLMTGLMRNELREKDGITFEMLNIKEEFLKKLPFAATGAQQRAMDELAADMQRPVAMNRLLQGDVGSGKTAVAMFAMYGAVKNGYQAVLMAPTEILAEQHYGSLRRMFGENVLLLTGGMKKDERAETCKLIRAGAVSVVVGTHALICDCVEFNRLGLVIADEQHRFGVRQRAALAAKGAAADVLIMSATPIPRTLALMLYGDLDVSVLNELPPGRKPVVTRYVPSDRRDSMYAFIDERTATGKQAYVVCPLVEKSNALADVISAAEVYKELANKLRARVGLLHGQMSASQKNEAISAFRDGKTDVLVCTTVIEVGVDVPNASVMVIEGAERFGLAQLHQLRGRVGRGSEKSYCFLLSETDGVLAMRRLDALTKTQDGFALAQQDLIMRGPGEFLGQRQHGISEFSAMQLADDMNVLEQAAAAADLILCEKSPNTQEDALIARARQCLKRTCVDVAPN
ncbi:MAG: ATP-dependent DNA helicase RecG [Clostridia bacterium]